MVGGSHVKVVTSPECSDFSGGIRHRFAGPVGVDVKIHGAASKTDAPCHTVVSGDTAVVRHIGVRDESDGTVSINDDVVTSVVISARNEPGHVFGASVRTNIVHHGFGGVDQYPAR